MTSLHRYLIYGVDVESDLELATVPEIAAPRSPPVLRLRLRAENYFAEQIRGLAISDDDWIQHHVLFDGRVYIRVREALQTIVSADGREATCAWMEGADARAFEANLLNFVLSTSLTLQGEEPLHSTVVDLGGKVIGLLGLSGAGKSTLAACLIAEGGELVTDDMLRLELGPDGATVHPGPYRLKLHRDSAERFLPSAAERGHFNRVTDKILVQPSAGPRDARRVRPLHALFWLGDPAAAAGDERPIARRLGGIELGRVLIASAMNIRYHAPVRLERQMRFAQAVAAALPVYALEYPRTFAMLERVTQEMRRIVSA